jgi:hypothetical protein
MSRRGAGRGGRRTTDRTPALGRRARRVPWAFAIVGIVAVAVAGWLILGPRFRPRGNGSGTGGDIASMSGEAAYQTALRLSRAGRHEESLPYYRQAVSGGAPRAWAVRYNYGGALYNAGLEVRQRDGVDVPAVRSSIERVALMREALAQLDAAEQLAPTPADRATVMRARGERFQMWGFPWEGFVMLRRAQRTDPGRPELVRVANVAQRVLEHPEQHPEAGADSAARR